MTEKKQPEKETAEEVMQKHWPFMADLVIDEVGCADVLTEGIKFLNSRGRMVLFGYDRHAVSAVPPSLIVGKELSLVGALGKYMILCHEMQKDTKDCTNEIQA